MFTGAGLLLLLLARLLIPEPGLGCPSACECWTQNRTVGCGGRGLGSVPRGIPSGTRALDLSRNRIGRVGGPWAWARRLELLDLSHNLVPELEAGAFGGLDKLRVLRLGDNRLRFVSPGALDRLPGLTALELGHNPLLLLLDHGFRALGRLRRLELGAAQLAYIGPQAFAGLEELTVQRAAVDTLPAGPLSHLGNLTVLRLRHLPNVGAVPGGSFRALSRLRVLELDGWASLGELGPDSLLGLNLVWLSVTRCNLSAVPYASLGDSAFLRFLDLSHNPIRAIRGALLQHVTRLEELRLVGGKLVTVEPAAFRGLVHFRLLDVSANRLPSLEQSAFRSVGGLQSLGLGGNPLACDCRLLWIVRRLRRLRFIGPDPACASPPALRGRRLTDPLPAASFTCRKPRIRDKRPQRVSVREGQTAALRCAADGEPPPDILWFNPRRKALSGGPGPDSGPAAGRSRVLPDGTLEIRHAQRQDAGTYRCVARSAGGNDTASAVLQVRPLSPEELALLNLPGQPEAPGSGYPLDATTLLVTLTMGFASFLGVVTLCFALLFVWSRGNGPVKHNTHIEFVPRSGGGGGGGGGDGGEAKFNMRMV
ncbi:leucine-rich repeat and immunoglobulin-like domain-containing nogo receptor-interacting protein 1 [Heptranchias perlo]|uniref:leucine-rich repeat and immunoglobulin-like domain-containing nogo receptor-interacting protein 1 n=1 Tax=Heptranchias perlo TaxID=212740 RepID=UPI003559F2D9